MGIFLMSRRCFCDFFSFLNNTDELDEDELPTKNKIIKSPLIVCYDPSLF